MTQYAFPDLHMESGGDHRFTGAVRLGEVARSRDGRNVRIQKVDFQPGARTHWHMHSSEQVLIVLVGTCLLKRFGEPATCLATGQSASIAANIRHWHGASDARMEHLAVNVGGETWWMEVVGESDYRDARNQAETTRRA
jgi:quercetin dioxygenase-like cupin family protein